LVPANVPQFIVAANFSLGISVRSASFVRLL
jgi:hypothetical protein